MKMPLHLKLAVFLRSFFIQNGWNFKSLISLGFCFAIVPLARRLYGGDIEKYNAFMRRQLNFFNAHPYFAAFALGSVSRLETDRQADPALAPEKIEKLKSALIGPLGALGDGYYWAIIRPATLAFAVAGLLLFEDAKWRLIFLALLFILYNLPHLHTRWQGLSQGYELGFGVSRVLKSEHFSKLGLYRWLGAVSLGIIGGIVILESYQTNIMGPIVFAGSALIAAFLKRRKSMSYHAMLLPLALAILAGMVYGL